MQFKTFQASLRHSQLPAGLGTMTRLYLTVAVAAVSCLFAASPLRAEPLADPASWPYLPQCHQCATPVIFERSGIDSAQATILARVTEEMAADYCANFAPGQALTECTADVLRQEDGKTYSASADCAAGRLIDNLGRVFQVAGTWQNGLAAGRVRLTDADGETVQVGLHVAGLPLSTQWSVLCPTVMPIRDDFVRRDSAFDGIVGIDHNGSFMWVSDDLSVIYYESPKASLAGIVEKGQVLYRGDPFPTEPGAQATGTAYTFRKGCEPAPYTVTGGATADGQLILRGASPVRAKQGCEIVGYTHDSGNATLVFDFHYGDV
jgi:hypothetical protein